MIPAVRRQIWLCVLLVVAGSAMAEPQLPPGRTGGNGSNQAAGPSGQNPGQAGEIGGAGAHPGPLGTKARVAHKKAEAKSKR